MRVEDARRQELAGAVDAARGGRCRNGVLAHGFNAPAANQHIPLVRPASPDPADSYRDVLDDQRQVVGQPLTPGQHQKQRANKVSGSHRFASPRGGLGMPTPSDEVKAVTAVAAIAIFPALGTGDAR